jgi:ADP-ribosyl-[dinitrogen reductase] hydrolase
MAYSYNSEDTPVQTSQSHPLRIAEVSAGPNRGLIGITFAPGKKQKSAFSGRWDRSLAADLDLIAAWNAAAVVTLVESHELESLQISAIGSEVRRRHMEWHHLPIEDVSVPDSTFEATWDRDSSRLRSLLEGGCNVLIHCKGGLGRAGMVAARLLVELGTAPAKAIELVRAARSKDAIETPQQEGWVCAGISQVQMQPSPEATQDRARGALLGLAAGDAVGTTIEFTPKPKYALLGDMVGGGPFQLKVGQWTDDTAMALALADSLAAFQNFNALDLMTRFVDWSENGTYSCTGTCFDIGNTTRAALNRFERTKDPIAGATDSRAAGNGALMRFAPVAIRYWADRPKLREVAALQTRATHGAVEAVEASLLFAEILSDAIAGRSREEVLAPRSGSFSPKVQAIASGKSWRGRRRVDITGSGYVVDCLNAALWAVSRTTDFRSAVLLAANLGDDADTTAAVAGQLAGALYGSSGIPKEWLAKLAWRTKIESVANQLFSNTATHSEDEAI